MHVGVLGVASGDSSGPLTIPVWYSYQPGGTVNVSTGRGTRKARAIEAAGRFSLCAQDERLDLARRFLGAEAGDAYIAGNPGGTQVMIRMTPEHWLTADFSKTYG